MIVRLTRRETDWEARIDGDPERSRTHLLPHGAVRSVLEAYAPTVLARDTIPVEFRTQDLRRRTAAPEAA